jgi:hypothetical protein
MQKVQISDVVKTTLSAPGTACFIDYCGAEFEYNLELCFSVLRKSELSQSMIKVIMLIRRIKHSDNISSYVYN